jgi:hypothetical protein
MIGGHCQCHVLFLKAYLLGWTTAERVGIGLSDRPAGLHIAGGIDSLESIVGLL